MGFRRRFNSERIRAAAGKDSFYLVLFLCLVLLATTAVWVTRNNIKYFSGENLYPQGNQMQEEYQIEELPVEGEEAVSVDKEQGQQEEQQTENQVGDPEQKPAQDTKDKEVKEQPQMVTASKTQDPAPKEERMLQPVLGKITMDFGKDNLVYSNTLEQWTTHYGIDISAGVGTPVKAVMSGTVADIATDSMFGIMITIDHGNGLVTRYANLQNDNMVKKGQKVERGKVISGVGTTAEFEIADQPHLHFEVLKDGKHQDPKLYLPNM